MCTSCGCASDETQVDNKVITAAHFHSRTIELEQDILDDNRRYAEKNRHYLQLNQVYAVNLMSSPGAGKTTLLTRTISDLKHKIPIAVVEGDQQTDNDAARIRATGVNAVQINTGKGCHLDAHMINHALDDKITPKKGLLFIENVGNLVCPAAFDLGENTRIVMLSVTEGDDKPLKYPDIFHSADVVVLTKTDLLPYVDFDIGRCSDFARRMNHSVEIMQLSAKTGEGLTHWYDWLGARCKTNKQKSLEYT